LRKGHNILETMRDRNRVTTKL